MFTAKHKLAGSSLASRGYVLEWGGLGVIKNSPKPSQDLC